MSDIFCTTMLASYKRPLLLMKAIDSLNSRADQSAYRIIVRLSYQDPDAKLQAEQILDTHKNVTVLIGPHLFYEGLGDYFTRMSQLATGKWLHIFDDDMTMDGGSWWDELKKAPDRALVLCERYRCGGSEYGVGSCDGSGIGWFIPNGCWREIGANKIEHPPDIFMKNLLVGANGWPIHHLKGVLLNHQWQRPIDGNR